MTTFPVEVKNEFDRSDALDTHIAARLASALNAYATHIQHVEVRLSDVNGPRHGAGDKMAAIVVTVRPSGRALLARAGADDIYESVTLAARRARTGVGRYINRLEQRHRARRPAGVQDLAGGS